MNKAMILQVAAVSAISIGFGVLLNLRRKSENDGYDERQLVERGKGAQIAMATAMCYLLAMFFGLEFNLLNRDYILEISVWGLAMLSVIYDGYAIFHDAYLRQGEEYSTQIFRNISLGILWLSMVWMDSALDLEISWLQLALAFNYLVIGMMLVIRMLYQRAREKAEERTEECG